MPSTKLAALGTTLLLLAAGCGESRSISGEPGGTAGATSSCTTCHGDASRSEPTPLLNAAPPLTASGASPGAHQAHLHAGPFAGPLACTECHVVPTSAAHSNGSIEVTFGQLASSGGATPTFAGGSCSSVYCHGSTLGGSAQVPTWTGTVACGSCHGAPPASHAPTSTACATCHPGTVKTDGTIDVAGGLHVNGRVDLGGGGGGAGVHAAGWSDPAQHGPAAKRDLASCRTCHGNDYAGGSTGVSCNACHGGTAWQSNCTFCHGTQVAAYTAADLRKAAPPLGTQGQTSPTEPAVGAHQAHLLGGSIRGPLACNDCHAVPADLAHVDGAARLSFGPLARTGGSTPTYAGGSCSTVYCHGSTLGSAPAPSWTGDVTLSCTSCHGAPPPSHSPTSTACATCHPGTVKTDGTIDLAGGLHVNGRLDLGGGGGAGVHPAGWSDPAQHGLAAKNDLASCRSCHGNDYAGGSTGVSCNACHGGTAWQSNCTFCHGTQVAAYTGADLIKAAPPLGTQGETSATQRAVGAHQKHLSPALSSPLACAECHTVPGDLAHVNGAVAVTFGPLARTGGVSPAWNGASCSTSYCHGSFTNGTAAAPVWTSATALGCNACHRPQSGSSTANFTNEHFKHVVDKGVACANCHGTGYSATSVNAATHVDGARRVVFGGTWNGRTVSGTFSGGNCTISCHGSERW